MFSEKGKLTKLLFRNKDIKLTAKGEIDKRYAQNKSILRAIGSTKEEYNRSLTVLVNEGVGSSISDAAQLSVQENVADNLQDLVWDRFGALSQSGLDRNIVREIEGIPHVDDNVDYDNLPNPNQRTQYNAKIAGLNVNVKHWKDLEEKEQDPTKKFC